MPSPLPRTRAVLRAAVANRVFPGAIVEVGRLGERLSTVAEGALAYGDDLPGVSPSTIYDLASLTKVLSTGVLCGRLVDRGVLGLDDEVRQWSDAWRGADRAQVTIRDLLLHASGLPAHRRYFEAMAGGPAYEAAIGTEPLEHAPGTRSVYSDLGFILLGRILERAGGAPLDAQFADWCRVALPQAHPPTFGVAPPLLARVAPTEQDPWRGRMLRGEVHDENAAALGGVAGHAGLFGTVEAVGACARWWLAHADHEPWATFVRQGTVPGSSRALAWDTMRPTSSCGGRMSARAFGHTGFTGTSLWIDPGADRYVVLLSNRVHPTRHGEPITAVRPAIHDAVDDDLRAG